MPKAYIVQGLAFGDEGKGTITDYLVRRHKAKLVIRYNGGCQAAHNVVTPDGTHHTFTQFGSGTLAGAYTHLSRRMLVEPYSLLREATVLRDLGIDTRMLMTVDPLAVIVTPFHKWTNRYKEQARGDCRHGSVGLGIGEAREDELQGFALRIQDLASTRYTAEKLELIRNAKIAQHPHLDLEAGFSGFSINSMVAMYSHFYDEIGVMDTEDRLRAELPSNSVVFEGAQGVLLDETWGLEPHRSWTNCTFGNAEAILANIPQFEAEKIGVLRSYYTRHGAGPFPTEVQALNFPEPHNQTHEFMGKFRKGEFDAVLAKYAIKAAGGIDTLALTHLDRQMYDFRVRVGDSNPWYPESLEYAIVSGPGGLITDALGLKCGYITSLGPTWKDKFESSDRCAPRG